MEEKDQKIETQNTEHTKVNLDTSNGEEDKKTEANLEGTKKVCKVCGKVLEKVFRCSKCKKARYCGRDC